MSAAWSTVEYSGDRITATLDTGDRIASTWGASQLLRKMAREIVDSQHARNAREEARAVQMWIHNRVQYKRDPADAELIQDPITTVQKGGDCDDMAILAASLLRAIGHDARVASVRWKGREYASHAVAYDLTAQSVVDGVSSEWPEQWPPAGFELAEIKFKNKNGETVALNGLFSKLVKSLAKPFQKIFPAKTLLGKMMDPLGMTDPKRNLNLAGRAADLIGTTAAVVFTAGAASALMAGTGFAGVAGTFAAGASTIGSGAAAAGSWLAGAAGKAAGTVLLAQVLSKDKASPGATEQSPAQVQMGTAQGTFYDPSQGAAYSGGNTAGGGGGGGGGAYAGWTPPQDTGQAGTSAPSFPVVPVALGLGLLFIMAKLKK